MSQDYGPALWLGNASIHYGGWGFFKPRFIIIHGTAGDRSIESVGTTFAQRGSSTHYAVGMDGRVGQYVPETEAAWGNGPVTGPAGMGGDGVHHDAWWDNALAGNPNTETFSIEHCKASLDNSAPLTDAQKAASFALVKHLCEAHGIPARRADANGGVSGHFSMDPVNRSRCPGNYPWDELFAYLNGNGNPASGGGNVAWHDAPDGGATDDRGNHIGAGLNADRKARGIGADSYNGEQYVGGATTFRSFIAYTSGEVALWDGVGVQWDGAKVAAELLRLLNVERSKPAPTPPPPPPPVVDPVKEKAFAALQTLKSALAEL